MNLKSVRPFVSALFLSTSLLATAGTAVAQTTNITGTDPCPKGVICTTATPVTKTPAPSSSASTVLIMMSLLGLA